MTASEDRLHTTSRRSAIDALAVYRQLQVLRDRVFSRAIRSSFAAFGERTVVQPPLHVYGWRRIRVGSDVFIGAHCWVVALDVLATDHPTIDIGPGTQIAGSCVISAARRVSLGRSVLIGRNVHIADHKHAYSDVTRPVLEQGIDGVADVEVGDGAWLGNNTVVTPGVRIGRGTVIGANSVVTTSVPDFSVAVGAPARVVRAIHGEP